MKPSDLNTRPHRHGKNSDIIEQQRARIADLEAVIDAAQKRIEELQNELAMADDKAADMQSRLYDCLDDIRNRD